MANGELRLNEAQKKAIEHEGGPLLIIAGAGTGKTTVITERIKHLIATEKASPQEIVALTFTEKAAREMEERVDKAMPYGYIQMWISTYHSFADRVLRAEALHIGLDPAFKLMTQAESVQILRDHLYDFDLDYFRPAGAPTKFLSGMLQHFARLQDEDVSPDDYLSWVEKQKSDSEEEKLELKKWIELANAYNKYDELKNKSSFFDFGDLIVKLLYLFRERPNVLERYRKQFKYVLVDEFQDTNIAQYELIKMLAPPGPNSQLTVVGDDSQSIYKFRGAAVSNILTFKEDYEESTTIVLDENYRSKQEILDPAYSLIQKNNPDTLEARLGISKNLKSRRKPPTGGEVRFIHCDRVENEADSIAQRILDLQKEESYELGDFAILVRANNHADAITQAMRRHSIPFQFLGPGRLFRQDEVVDLISYLRVLYNFEDSISFMRVLSMKFFEIPARDLAALGNYARKQDISVYESAENPQDVQLSDKGREIITKIVDIIKDHLGDLNDETPGRILYDFLERTGILQTLIGSAADVNEKRVRNISKFFDKLKTYEVDHPRARFAEVVDWLELSAELGESPLAADTDWQDNNSVNILTVHSAKGLEFPVVFLPNLVSQRFPTMERSEQIPIPEELIKEELPQGDYHMQEERRLFYVGMTRAMDRLYLTAADYYGEGKREKKISPFVFEALGEDADKGLEENKYEQLSLLNYQNGSSNNESAHKEEVKINYLSHSQIDTFMLCPLHYKLRYILGIPTRPSPAQSIGSSVHAALNTFYSHLPKTQKKAEEQILVDLEKNWKFIGFDGKKHEKKAYETAKNFLVGYVSESFNPNVNPILLEKQFAVPILRKDEESLLVGGIMDRVDQLESGRIEIIDYKTGGKVPSQREVDKNLQLSIYALAATLIPDKPFGKEPDEVLLSLYYFEEQKKITTKRTKADLEKVKDQIFEIRKQIENSDFQCSNHYLCLNGCEYDIFCRAEY